MLPCVRSLWGCIVVPSFILLGLCVSIAEYMMWQMAWWPSPSLTFPRVFLGHLSTLICTSVYPPVCQWKLIDLVAASAIGTEPACHKYSSAYLPPEAIHLITAEVSTGTTDTTETTGAGTGTGMGTVAGVGVGAEVGAGTESVAGGGAQTGTGAGAGAGAPAGARTGAVVSACVRWPDLYGHLDQANPNHHTGSRSGSRGGSGSRSHARGHRDSFHGGHSGAHSGTHSGTHSGHNTGTNSRAGGNRGSFESPSGHSSSGAGGGGGGYSGSRHHADSHTTSHPEINSNPPPYTPLIAHPSFDVWSLGCILYQMCTPDVRPLFASGQYDHLYDHGSGVGWGPQAQAQAQGQGQGQAQGQGQGQGQMQSLLDDDNLVALAEW